MNKIRPTTWIVFTLAVINAALIPISEQPLAHTCIALFAGIAASVFARQDKET